LKQSRKINECYDNEEKFANQPLTDEQRKTVRLQKCGMTLSPFSKVEIGIKGSKVMDAIERLTEDLRQKLQEEDAKDENGSLPGERGERNVRNCHEFVYFHRKIIYDRSKQLHFTKYFKSFHIS